MEAHVFTEVLLRSNGKMQRIRIVIIGELIFRPVLGEKVSHKGFAGDTEMGDATLEEGIISEVKWRPQRCRRGRQN